MYKIYSKVIEMKRAGYHVHNSYRFLRESPDFLKHKKIHWKCDSPDLYFSISPSGKFLPCVDIDTDINMLDPRFLDLFFSEDFRNNMRERVKNCFGCMYACYPEITFFCRDSRVFFERLLQGFKISRFKRREKTYEDLLKLTEKIKEKYPATSFLKLC